MRQHLVWLVLACPLLLVTAVQAEDSTEQRLAQRLRAHIEFLADDLLRGRQTGSVGYNIAANYVRGQFRQIGLLPANQGDYFQQVPLRSAMLEPGSAQLSIAREGRTTPLVFVQQFFMRPDLAHTDSSLQASMVFVGYGIEAPELNYNDYAEVDVNGKVVVFLTGQPQGFPSEEGAHFSSTMQRKTAAVRHGAIGMVMLHTPRAEQRFSWDRIKRLKGMPTMGWLNAGGEPHGAFKQLRNVAYVHHSDAEVFFEEAPHSLQSLLERDEKGERLPVFELYGTVSMHQRSQHKTVLSPNIVGVLRGGDAQLADQYVVYTAHLDHLGVLPANGAKSGHRDLINNGALDNAAGVAVLLETARLFARGLAPRRSILFLTTTGEEKGLVGAGYFAMNPTVPRQSMVSEINLDMPLLLYDFADVIAFGAEHSSLGDAVTEAAHRFGVTVTPDPFPEQNIFVRSDHYRFVQQGIPAVFLVTGVTSRDRSVDARSIFADFLQKHYHQPSDDLSLPIDYRAAARFTKINKKIGELVANQTQRPVWRKGDFFGRTFAR